MGKYAMHEAVSFNDLARRSSLAQGKLSVGMVGFSFLILDFINSGRCYD